MNPYFIFWGIVGALGLIIGTGLAVILYHILADLDEAIVHLRQHRSAEDDRKKESRDRWLAEQINQLLVFISAARERFADAKKQEGGETLAKTLALDIASAYVFAYELTIQRPYGASMKLKEEALLRLAEMWLGHADVGHNYPAVVKTNSDKIAWLREQILKSQMTCGRYFTNFGARE